MKKLKIGHVSFSLILLFSGVFLCAFTAWGIVPDIKTGSMDYWDENIPAKYVYDSTQNNPEVNTGTMDYWNGSILAAQYVYEIDYVPPTDPTSVAFTPVGGTVVANTLNTTNTNFTASAAITAGQATGGQAELLKGGASFTTPIKDTSIAAGDTISIPV